MTAQSSRAWAWWLLSVVLLLGFAVLSLFIGSGDIPPATVWSALWNPQDLVDHSLVRDLRMPRTVLAVLVGAALGVAGALAQAVTRNPLADPGILGVNAGAGFAITVSVAAFGLTSIDQYLWIGMLGALATSVLVYGVSARGPGGPEPLRLTLVGVAVSAVLMGASRSLALLRPTVFDQMRFWSAGTLVDRPEGTIAAVAPGIAVGVVVALLCARPLDALALGEDVGRSVGVRVLGLRLAAVAVVTVLCGSATAAVGPISFIGLMVPHAVRFVTGPDQKWILLFSLTCSPILLLASDILGRVVVYPGELQAGIVTAFLGGPVLVWLVRRSSRRSL